MAAYGDGGEAGAPSAQAGRRRGGSRRQHGSRGADVLQGGSAREDPAVRDLRGARRRPAGRLPPAVRRAGVALPGAPGSGVRDPPLGSRPRGQPDARLGGGRLPQLAAALGAGRPASAGAGASRPARAVSRLVLVASAPDRGRGALRRRRAAGRGLRRSPRSAWGRDGPGPIPSHDAALVRRGPLADAARTAPAARSPEAGRAPAGARPGELRRGAAAARGPGPRRRSRAAAARRRAPPSLVPAARGRSPRSLRRRRWRRARWRLG